MHCDEVAPFERGGGKEVVSRNTKSVKTVKNVPTAALSRQEMMEIDAKERERSIYASINRGGGQSDDDDYEVPN